MSLPAKRSTAILSPIQGRPKSPPKDRRPHRGPRGRAFCETIRMRDSHGRQIGDLGRRRGSRRVRYAAPHRTSMTPPDIVARLFEWQAADWRPPSDQSVARAFLTADRRASHMSPILRVARAAVQNHMARKLRSFGRDDTHRRRDGRFDPPLICWYAVSGRDRRGRRISVHIPRGLHAARPLRSVSL